MADWSTLALFLLAAVAISLTPGPGLLYVAARTLSGGAGEGLASILGLGLGGLAHVAAGALGVSALVLASAEAFTLLKFVGALYLVWLGIKAWRQAGAAPVELPAPTTARQAFREGVVVEALNPKTAAFFLAFLPQFVDPTAGSVALQFLVLGSVTVLLNTLADLLMLALAARLRERLFGKASLLRRLRQASAALLCGLGLTLAFARRPG
ncbi:MAG TPA: LysE family translocator [Kiloniellales bacterium]|nr:LysE family translocator [Kiloniellales bacterium]